MPNPRQRDTVLDLKGANLAWITDGLSKTILVREMAGGPLFIQGKSTEDHPGSTIGWIRQPFWVRQAISLNQSIPAINYSNHNSIYAFHPNGAHVSMCDGSVRFLQEGISHEVVFAMITRARKDNISQGPQVNRGS